MTSFVSNSSSSSEDEVDAKVANSGSDTEIVLPPDELEMKHLKKLETMKESPA